MIRQDQQLVHVVVEQRPIVGYEHDWTGVAPQITIEPLDPRQVQVVRWLVEQQRLRLRGSQIEQRELRDLAARKPPCRRRRDERAQLQRHPRLLDDLARGDASEPIEQLVVRLGRLGRRASTRPSEALAGRCEGGLERLGGEQAGIPLAKRDHGVLGTNLSQVAGAGAVERAATAVRSQLVGEHTQQRRLAAPVRPHDAERAPRGHGERDCLEDRAAAELDGQVVGADHGYLVATHPARTESMERSEGVGSGMREPTRPSRGVPMATAAQ